LGMGDGVLGIGDWGLGIGPNPQSPIPNPQSPIPIFYNNNLNNCKKIIIQIITLFILCHMKIKIKLKLNVIQKKYN